MVFTDVERTIVDDLPFGRAFKCDHCGQLIATKRVTFQDVMIGKAGQVNMLLCEGYYNLDGQKVVTRFLDGRGK
jgi:hypothetical protein